MTLPAFIPAEIVELGLDSVWGLSQTFNTPQGGILFKMPLDGTEKASLRGIELNDRFSGVLSLVTVGKPSFSPPLDIKYPKTTRSLRLSEV